MRKSFVGLLLACSVLFASQAHATTYNLGDLLSYGSTEMGAGRVAQGPYTDGLTFYVDPPSYVSISITNQGGLEDEHLAVLKSLDLAKPSLSPTAAVRSRSRRPRMPTSIS